MSIRPITQYTDDASSGIKVSHISKLWCFLNVQGTARGYFPDTIKATLMTGIPNISQSRGYFSDPDFKVISVNQYLGIWMGHTEEIVCEFIQEKLEPLISGINNLAKGVTILSQNKYTYFQQLIQQ